LKVFEYSNSTEFLVASDTVKYDKTTMTKPVYDLILGVTVPRVVRCTLDL
jgi:hypothetical protein